jgi:hypothetical protein
MVIRGVRIAAAVAFAVAVGWWWWTSRLPRPDLLGFVPSNATLVIQVRDGRAALAALRAADAGGHMAGPHGLLDRQLADLAGPGLTSDRVAAFARDEGVFAVLPGGGYLAACRLGARERLADRFLAGTRLVRHMPAPGGVIRLARLPGGQRIAYTITRGTVLVSPDPARLVEALARPGDAPPPQVAALQGPLSPEFLVRILVRGGPGEIQSMAAQAGLSRHRAVLEAHLVLNGGGPWAAWLEQSGASPPARLGPAWHLLPSDGLAAVALARFGDFAASPVARDDPMRTAIGRLPRGVADCPAGIALLSIDHRGVVPMPQAVAAFVGGGPWLDEEWVRALDARLRRETGNDLRLDRTVSGGSAVWTVNFPVTRTLGPSLTLQGTDALVASSRGALDRALAASSGAAEAMDRSGFASLAAPAHAALVLNLPGLAREAEAIVAGLREYGLLNPAAETHYGRNVEPWLRAAEETGRLVLVVRLAPRSVDLSGELLP